MTVAEAQQRVDSREFASWMAYDRVDPFGEERADLRSAIVAATLANIHRGKNAKPFEAADFMPRFDRAKPKQTPTEMQARLFQFAEMHNANIKRARA